jgi:hypothetical protein
MKPRREKGATLVSPMTSEVSGVSALVAALLFLGGAFSLQTRREGKSPACEMLAGRGNATGPKIGHKKTRPSTQYTVNDLASPGY